MTPQAKKTVLITGGSRGIGHSAVLKFKENGWNVATCATGEARLQQSPADLKFLCNVAKAHEVKRGIEKVLHTFGQIDAVVNNAGLAGSNPLSPESDDEFWLRILDVNLNGTYYMSKYVAPHLPDRTGRIINIASVLALKGVPDQTAYCAAKHAVLGFTRAFAQHLAPRKITVNAICPGWVRTEMAEGRMKEIGMTENDISTSVPLARFVEPSEVADLIYFLASSEASAMITGQALTIDGGTLP